MNAVIALTKDTLEVMHMILLSFFPNFYSSTTVSNICATVLLDFLTFISLPSGITASFFYFKYLAAFLNIATFSSISATLSGISVTFF